MNETDFAVKHVQNNGVKSSNDWGRKEIKSRYCKDAIIVGLCKNLD